MRLLCVIPARIGSTRLPQKPLRRISGTPLIRLVAQRVLAFELDGRIVIATDDRRVAEAVRGVPVDIELTDPRQRSGTERVAEVAMRPRYADCDVILNIQGDEPFLPAAAARGALVRVRQGDPIGTAAAPLEPGCAADPNRVKVVVSDTGHALAFSRAALAPAPVCRQHVGVYAYTRGALFRWVSAPPGRAEQVERLEQLRPLGLGIPIGVSLLAEGVAPGIDTEDDLQLAEAYLSSLTAGHQVHVPFSPQGRGDRGEGLA